MNTMETQLTFRDVYKFPLHINEICPNKVLTADNKIAFDFCLDMNYELKQQIVNNINGLTNDFSNQFIYKNGLLMICNGNCYAPFLRIRGYGYLTGIDGLNLLNEVAMELQDQFGEFIAEQLSFHKIIYD